MRSWKRRTRGIRKKQKRLWYFLYAYPGKDIHTVHRLQVKDKRRIDRDNKLFMDEVRQRAELKTHYEDCFDHPCLITSLDYKNDDIRGISLVDGTSPRSCSLSSCAVEFFSESEAVARANYIKEHGWDKYNENYTSF